MSIISEDVMISLLQIYSQVQWGNRSDQTTTHGNQTVIYVICLDLKPKVKFDSYYIIKSCTDCDDEYSRSSLTMDSLGVISV